MSVRTPYVQLMHGRAWVEVGGSPTYAFFLMQAIRDNGELGGVGVHQDETGEVALIFPTHTTYAREA